MYIQPNSTYIDTIELAVCDDKCIETEISTIPYNEGNLKNIKIGKNLVMYPDILQCEGHLIKNDIGNIVFYLNDFEILLRFGKCMPYINIKREFYIEELFNHNNKDFISIILFSDRLEVVISIENKDIIIKDIKINDYKDDIFDLIQYILDYFSPLHKSYISIDILQGYVKLTREKLEKFIEIYNWDDSTSNKNIFEVKNALYYYGKIEKDKNDKFKLIMVESYYSNIRITREFTDTIKNIEIRLDIDKLDIYVENTLIKVDILNYINDIYNLIKYILDYFTFDKDYKETINYYNNFNKENLENIYKSYNKIIRYNKYVEDESITGNLFKNNDGKYKLIF
jgi:hypothetical protein